MVRILVSISFIFLKDILSYRSRFALCHSFCISFISQPILFCTMIVKYDSTLLTVASSYNRSSITISKYAKLHQ